MDANPQKWNHEGFQTKKRVQRYSLEEIKNDLKLDWLLEQIAHNLPFDDKVSPTELIVEERFPPPSIPSHYNPSSLLVGKVPAPPAEPPTGSIVYTFESLPLCSCLTECKCFTAQMTLFHPSIQTINCPIKRHPECWALLTSMEEECKVDLFLPKHSLLIKTKDALWKWRYHTIAAASNHVTTDDKHRCL
eukprot:10798014-Ditylum_brightwellii.AAC.1